MKSGNQGARVYRARARALAGDRTEAAALVAETTSHADRAVLNLALGQIEEALNELEQGITRRDPVVYTLRVDPVFDSLRHLPEFARIAQQFSLGWTPRDRVLS